MVSSRVKALPRNSAAVTVHAAAFPSPSHGSGASNERHISVAAARYQAARVARARGLPLGRVQALIAARTRGRLLGVIGEPRVNLLELNLALDALK